MLETTQKKRRWVACACSECRFVFRVPKQHDGVGVVCPACHHLSRLPEEKKPDLKKNPGSQDTIELIPRDSRKVPPVVARSIDDVEPLSPSEQASGSFEHHASKRRPIQQELPEWERETEQVNSSRYRQKSPLPWVVGGTLLGLTLVGLGAWVVLGTVGKQEVAKLPGEDIQWESHGAVTEEKPVTEEIQNFLTTGNDVLESAEPIIERFLTVENFEDFRPLVRFPDVAMPRIEEWYKHHPLKTKDVKEVGYGGSVTVKNNMTSLTLQMKDYTLKQIALVRTDDGYRIDWESWVGWTEMSWEQLIKERPTEPQIVLVRAKIDAYYNRDFTDEAKWVSITLNNPNSDRTLYGYVDREDPTLTRLISGVSSGEVAVTVKIRYPENARAGNQVIITEFIFNGWVAPEKEDDEKAEPVTE